MSASDVVHEDTVALRVATPDDAAALAHFAARTFADTFGPDNTPDDMAVYLAGAFDVERQRAELADPEARVWIAVAPDGALAGYAHLRRGDAPACVAAACAAEIARLYVDRPWQGRGLAGQLMDACLGQARAWRCDAAWLGVWQRNARAIAFYARHGFRPVGTQTFHLGRDAQTDDVMALRL